MSRLAYPAFALVLLTPLAATAEPAAAEGRWGFGFHASAISLESTADPEDRHELGGAGLQVRLRLSPRWELEAATDHVEGTREEDGLSRDLRLFTLGAMFHLNPQSRWTWSLVAGLGGGREEVTQDRKGRAEFAQGHAYLGVGLERRFEHIALAAQLRAVSLSRDEEELDGPAFAGRDVPIPQESAGAQLSLMASYYF